ncbi:MAG: hypothetical protein ACD_76C00120G0006 [uncultured bacterium]|nr:MAG: hypothetical protein ACD_76C00120G0006 [uncultured bacterium]
MAYPGLLLERFKVQQKGSPLRTGEVFSRFVFSFANTPTSLYAVNGAMQGEPPKPTVAATHKLETLDNVSASSMPNEIIVHHKMALTRVWRTNNIFHGNVLNMMFERGPEGSAVVQDPSTYMRTIYQFVALFDRIYRKARTRLVLNQCADGFYENEAQITLVGGTGSEPYYEMHLYRESGKDCLVSLPV